MIDQDKGPGSISPKEKNVCYGGRLLWFNQRTGHGCIVRDDGMGDCFVHANAIQEAFYIFKGGEEVQFEIEKTNMGPRAINVRLVHKKVKP